MTFAFILVALAIFTAVYLHLRFAADQGGASGARHPVPLHAPAAFAPRAASKVQPLPSRLAEPQLEMLEWDDAREVSPAAAMPPAQARIRDRYLAARFEGAIRGAGDLCMAERVIDVARLYFEEDRADCAHELLALAIEATPGEARLRLARLEIAFLTRDGATFLEAARALDLALPGCAQWRDVQRLGRALLPRERLFGAAGKPRAHEHYGAWPDTPNWISACWDLTGDVHAADFHLAMSRAPLPACPALRSAA